MNRLFSRARETQRLIDERLFDGSGLYSVYRCKGVQRNRAVTGLLAAGSGFFLYRLATGDLRDERAEDLLLACVAGLAFGFHAFCLRRSLLRLQVDRVGPGLEVELYDWLGLRSRRLRLASQDLVGLTTFLHPRLKMPIVVYRNPQTGKKSFFLYKSNCIEDRETFELVCRGQPFLVGAKEEQVHAVKKKRMV